MSKEQNETNEINSTQGVKTANKTKLAWTGGIVGGIILVIYLAFSFFYFGKFFQGTTINGVDCGGMSVAEAQAAIIHKAQDYVLTVESRTGEAETINGDDISLEVDLGDSVDKQKEEQIPFLWFLSFFQNKDYEVQVSASYDEKTLEKKVEALSCFNKENMVKPENAKLGNYSAEDGFEIIEEKKGSYALDDTVLSETKNAISVLQDVLSLDEAGCYKEADYVADSKEVVAAKDVMDGYAKTNITYSFGSNKEVVDGSIISKWLTVDDQYKVKVRKKKIEEYVQKLADQYDTYGTNRKFITSYGKTVKVGGGDYGWRMNVEKETKKLTKLIEKGATKNRTPAYFQKGKQYGFNDIGDTYVEINLQTQHLFFYKKGKLIVQSDFVSGNVAKNTATPTGLYDVSYKQSPAVLRGQGYNSPVSYWMPFNGGIGLHDANWRHGIFGGTIYLTRGSHGCINLPVEVAHTIYNHIEAGYPVICYKLAASSSDISILTTNDFAKITGDEVEPTKAPETTAEPSKTPKPTKKPSPTLKKTEKPKKTATPTPKKTASPKPKKTATPKPKATATPKKTATPAPTQAPTQAPTVAPTPVADPAVVPTV